METLNRKPKNVTGRRNQSENGGPCLAARRAWERSCLFGWLWANLVGADYDVILSRNLGDLGYRMGARIGGIQCQIGKWPVFNL